MKCLLTSNIVKEKKFRIVGAIILSVFVITVIILCSTLLRSGDDRSNSVDENSTEIPSPFTKALIVQIGNSDLWALDLDNENSTYLIKNWKDRIHSFDYHLKKTAYIGSSEFGMPIKSTSGQYPELLQPVDWVADEIAVDYVNHKVYVLDVLASNINIFDLWENHYNIVLSNCPGCKDIAIDSVKRLLFILQSSSIVRTNIDGSSWETIVETTALFSFTLDYDRNVYYADLESINRVNYTGHEHKIVSKISDIVISMAALENSLFWLYKSYDFENSILYSCEITNGSCTSFSESTFSETLIQIKAYNFEKNKISNPCQDHNRNCEHLCIMNSIDSSLCACSIGWQLDADSKSCKKVNEFLFYVERNYIKSQILSDSSGTFVEAMVPLKLNTSFSTDCNLDFDVRKRVLVFSDERNTYQMNLKSNGEQVKIMSHEDPYVTILAIDWISSNLYYTTTIIWTMGPITMYDMRVKVHYMQSSESFGSDYEFRISDFEPLNITSLTIHPNKGLLFCTIRVYRKLRYKIQVLLLDGKFTSDYGQNLSVSGDRNVLGIDYEDDRLYWFNEDKKSIHFADLDGIDIKSINIKTIENPLTMSIYKNWLYVSTPTSLWRLDKLTGQNVIQISAKFQEDSKIIFGSKIFSRITQPISKNHPCMNDNGDCQRYCFGIPSGTDTLRKVCGCGENEKLNPDSNTCYKLL